MSLSRPQVVLVVVAGLLLVVAIGLGLGRPNDAGLLVAISGLASLGCVLAAIMLGRPAATPPRERFRPDLDRLRPGRLRDGCIHVAGYCSQLAALAETATDPTLRAMLQRDVPLTDATLRAVYALCLNLQAYELGEAAGATRPPSELPQEDDPRVDAAESELQATLDTLSALYADLRQRWSPAHQAVDLDVSPLAVLEPHIDQLRQLAGAFGPVPASALVARQES